MYLHLYNGEQFENLKSQSVISRNVPYRRETFKEKHTLIAFDTNFEMVDGNFLNQRSDIKNMNEISLAIDSLNMYADSVGRAMYSDAMKTTYRKPVLSKTDSTNGERTSCRYQYRQYSERYDFCPKAENAEYNRNATFFAHVGLEHEELYDPRC